MKSKLKFIIPGVVVLLVALKFTVLKSPPVKEPKKNVHGTLYVMPKDFLINLEGGRYAKLGMAMVLEPALEAAAAGGEGSAAPKPPDGYGDQPQEALVRAIITDTLTGVSAGQLTESHSRDALLAKILKKLKKKTDVEVDEILITDLAVQ